MLSIENANLHYGAAQALRGVSLKAEQAKITCVLGRNGVGKSSLLRAIVGHQPLSSGAILFEGKDFGQAPPMSVRARASPMCRRGGRYFRCCRCAKIWRPAMRR